MKRVKCSACGELYECRLSDTFSLDCKTCKACLSQAACTNKIRNVDIVTEGLCPDCYNKSFQGGLLC